MVAIEADKLDFTQFYNIIDGQRSETSETRNGINPSTLEKNPPVPISTAQDVNRAVSVAQKAARAWSRTPWSERQQSIVNFADALLAAKDEFASLLVREQGKPLPLAYDEVQKAAQWLSVQANLTLPEHTVEESDERKVVTRYVPLGVALAIVPWNYPLMLACGKISPALLTGNAMILKPSPYTPYTGLKLVELAQKFFPPGVLQALSGGDDLGPLLTEHPGIDKVSFTGSTSTGKRVMKSCSNTLKRVTLELGGNDPAIVCSDVDVKPTADMITRLAFLNSGQICVCIKRVYVHASIYDEFLETVKQTAQSLKVGDGFGGVDIGPVQNAMQYDRVNGLLEGIKAQKLNISIGGTPFSENDGKGYFITPTIVDNPPDTSNIVVEEPFGPVFPLLKWNDEEEVLRRANDSDMGLGASIWSKDLRKAEALADRLDAGTVWINSHSLLQPDAAFAGHKMSGIGGEWGVEGLRSYCNTKTLFLRKK